MSMWRQLTRGLRTLLHRQAADRDIADEVDHYLEQSTADAIARGLSPEAASRHARLALNATAAREEIRSYGWENTLETALSDLRYASRRLLGSPGFTAVSVLTLALGIGAATAIFTVVDGVLLKPLPYPHSNRLVALRHTAPGIHVDDLNLAASLYFTYAEENHAFETVGLWQSGAWSITGLAEPEQVKGLAVSHDFLPTLQVRPAVGRPFTPADDDRKNGRTVILSDGYWKSHFGGDRAVLGRRLIVDGNPHEIIGVLPPSFQFMDRKIAVLLPMRLDRASTLLISFCCEGFARLKPGVTLAQANADVARMIAIAPVKFPMNPVFGPYAYENARIGPNLRPLKDVFLGDIGNTLWVLMATVFIVLSIACANVANLLLVRADGRRQELAVRAALGAGLGRIARELLLESLLVSLTGGAFGVFFASAAVRALVAFDLPNLPRLHEISVDPVVVAFALAISLGAGFLFGLIPVFKYARPQLAFSLRSGGRSASQSKERHRARSLLVVVQVSLAVVLLIGSGLMIRTFQALRHVDPGFTGAERLETLSIDITEKQVPQGEPAIRMEEAILHKLERLPGVSSVAISDSVPLDGCCANNPIFVEDHAPTEGYLPPIRRFKFISPGYLSTVGARLIAGRDLTWAELYHATPVALISENMARELWRDPHAAIGKRIRFAIKDDWREVIGVVADLHDDGVDQKAPSIVYWPLFLKRFGAADAIAYRSVAFLIRTPRAGSVRLLEEIHQAVAAVNPALPVANVDTLQARYDRSLARTSFTMALLALAGAMSLLLGIIGIYGVISYSVSQRTREIGIRIALGAPLQNVTRMFVRHGLLLSAIGAACGLAAALFLTRLMKSILFDVSPADPLTYLAVSAALILVATLACYLPARRATRVDPLDALRAE